MKTIVTILSIGLFLISLGIVYIYKSGVSIRTAPIIRPSIVSEDFHNVPQGLFVRLFPDLQQTHYILWGVSQNSNEVQVTLSMMKELYKREFKTPVSFIYDGLNSSREEVQNCLKPCWILFPENHVNELSPNTWIQTHLLPLNRNYFSLTWIPFERPTQVPEYCVKEKRLDLDCLKVVSIQEVSRKMKDSGKRYFFLRKYLDRDYFLFVESPKN